MNEIPSMWREEVWHVLTVHLPLVTLLLASVCTILYIFIKGSTYDFLKKMAFVMLVLGVLGGWVAIYTGEIAYNIEVREICDPKILQQHQWWTYATLFTYSAALLVLSLGYYFSQHQKLLNTITSIMCTVALGGLLYSGHLGASLVYQQGAGTYRPSEKCIEFEK